MNNECITLKLQNIKDLNSKTHFEKTLIFFLTHSLSVIFKSSAQTGNVRILAQVQIKMKRQKAD